MSSIAGYLLRISNREWVAKVFDMAIYFTSLRRNWKAGRTILFLHRTTAGDALVGYGVIDKACDVGDLSEEDRRECEKGEWRTALEFRYVRQFEKPLVVKTTFLRSSKLRGKYFHGLGLDKNQVEDLVAQGESL